MPFRPKVPLRPKLPKPNGPSTSGSFMTSIIEAAKEYGPDALNLIKAYVDTSTNGEVNNTAALKQFLSTDTGVIVGSQAAVAAGIHPDEFLSTSITSLPQFDGLHASLLLMHQNISKSMDAIQPPMLVTSVADTAGDLVRVSFGVVLKRAFGSYENARMIQEALFAMKEADFQWLTAMDKANGLR